MKKWVLFILESGFATLSVQAQWSDDSICARLHGDIAELHRQRANWIKPVSEYRYCDSTDALSYDWLYQVFFTLPDTTRMGFKEAHVDTVLRLVSEPITRTLSNERVACFLCKKKKQPVILDQRTNFLSMATVLNKNYPCACIELDFGRVVAYHVNACSAEALHLRYSKYKDKVVFRPICQKGLISGSWWGCIDANNELRWFEFSDPDRTYTTEEIAACCWRNFIIRWYES